MKKTFKKAIAVLLAVLMAAFSVPFAALAAPGDYEPNIKLLFGSVSNVMDTGLLAGEDAYASQNAATKKDTACLDSLAYAGLYGAPLDYTYTKTGNNVDGETVSGTLSLNPAKAASLIEVINADNDTEYEAPDETYAYTVGDYFVVTVVAEGVETCNNMDVRLYYSENIEPAGIYGRNKSTTKHYDFMALSDVTSTYSIEGQDAAAPLAGQCADSFYGTINEIAGDLSEFDVDAREIHTSAVSSVPATDVSVTEAAGYFYDRTTGEAMDTLPENTMVLESYIFKIVDEGPIEFSMVDNHRGDYTNGSYIATSADGIAQGTYTSYTPLPQAGAAGSEKMTFMAGEVTPPPAECTHANTTVVDAVAATCTTNGYTGDTVCADCGETVATGSVIPATGHNYSSAVTTQPTCTAAGETTYTCANCGDQYTEAVPAATGHTEVSANNGVAATCTTDGKEADTVCSVCGETLATGATIPATGHTEVSADNAVAATCTTDGKEADTVCSVCGETLTTGAVIPATGHSYTSKVTVEPTCTTVGTMTYTCANCGDAYTEDIDMVAHTPVSADNAVAPTCTEAGKEADTVCSVCGETLETGATIAALGHTAGTPVAENATDATCTVAGSYDLVTYCTVCNEVLSTEHIDGALAPHTPVSANNGVDATCTTAGKEADTVCSVCGALIEEGATIPATGHTEVSANNGVAATCTTDGKEADTVCSVCGETIATGAVIPATGHTEVSADNAVAATCTTAGKEADTVCSVCGETIATGAVIPATGHTAVSANNGVAATIDAEGKEADTVCSVCGETLAVGATIPMLKSYTVTVTASDLGTVTLAGVDVTDGGSKKFAPNATAKLVATPVDGAKFVGWVANGTTTVSTSATYNAPVIANVTYTPEFVIDQADAFTVTFMDAYANVVSAQTVNSAADITIPAVPARPGYVAAGWSMTADEIAALTGAATITAQYTADTENKYTINAAGCTITTAAGDTATDTIAVPFDTKVTVTNDSATAFEINGVNVAYGTSYTFFATADVTITAVTSAVTATPQVVAIGVDSIVDAGKTKAVFKATKTMADGYTLVSSGYVYGKGDLGAITLDDVTGTTVKSCYTKTASNQFSLTYFLNAQTGTMTARAFLTYKDTAGTVTTVYADVQTYTYA